MANIDSSQIYSIYTPQHGFLKFKYDEANEEYYSVDNHGNKLPIYWYSNKDEQMGAGRAPYWTKEQLLEYALTVKELNDGIFEVYLDGVKCDLRDSITPLQYFKLDPKTGRYCPYILIDLVTDKLNPKPLQILKNDDALRLRKSDIEKLGWVVYNYDVKAQNAFTQPIIQRPINLKGDDADILQALMNDPAAMILYKCLQSTLPMIQSMAMMTSVMSNMRTNWDKANINQTQDLMKANDVQAAALKKQRNSALFKMIQSPIFSSLIGIISVILGVLSLFTAGATAGVAIGLWVTIGVLAAGLVATGIAVSVLGAQLRSETKNTLGEYYGDASKIPEHILEAFKEMDNMILTTTISTAISLFLDAILSVLGGFGKANSLIKKVPGELAEEIGERVIVHGAKGGMGSVLKVGIKDLLKKGLKKGLEKGVLKDLGKEALQTLLGALGNASIMAGVLTGIGQMRDGFYEKINAEFRLAMAELQLVVEKIKSESSFLRSITESLQDTLDKLMANINKLVQAQTNIIRTLGDESTTITRNMANI